jgi:site-specific recombinase
MKLLFSLLLLCTPAFVWAQGLSYSIRSPFCSYADDGAVISCGIVSIEGLVTAILQILLVIAVPVIVFFIIFAGFSYVTAQGNPEKIKTASRSLTYALIGAVLILGSVALAEIIKGIVTSLGTP